MPTTTNVQQVKVNVMTEAQYSTATKNPNEFYAVTDAQLSYNDLADKPTIGDATLTIQKNGTAVDTFTANATVNKTINITVPTQASDVGAVASNTAITGATKCKITYDSKGLVTAGADLSATDIPSLSLSKITDVTATASELNVLDGITATTTELNYVDGVTSSIQTQLNGKVSGNTAITGATKCKITYDSKGLVTAGADLSSGDVTTALGYTPYNGSVMTGADGTNAGTSGLVPAPSATDNTKYLRGDGTWQTVSSGGSYTAGTGIDITNNTISVTSPTLTNTATGSNALTILGTAATTTGTVNIGSGSSGLLQSVSVGQNAQATGNYGVAIGRATKAASYSVAIGYVAEATASNAVQLGYGTNSEANSFYVSTSTSNNWKMLGSDGKIPDARLNNPIPDQTSQSGKFLTTNGSAVSWGSALTNTATGSNSLTILGTSTDKTSSINIGVSSSVSDIHGVALGKSASTASYGISLGSTSSNTKMGGIALGYNAHTTAIGAIQLAAIGNDGNVNATNSESGSFYVALSNGSTSSGNYKLLGSDGKIPDGRLPIATSVSSSSTNADVVGAKLFYDTCGDIETLINAL